MSAEPLEKLEELARRAVACKRWRWMPGMLSDKGLRVTRCDRDGYVVGYYEDLSYIAECVAGTLPDLSDPATLGCLLALVREALKPRGWGVTLCLANTGAGWQLGYLAGGEWFSPLGTIHRSEAEALVAALEAAQ
jgi:hypothetical protein